MLRITVFVDLPSRDSLWQSDVARKPFITRSLSVALVMFLNSFCWHDYLRLFDWPVESLQMCVFPSNVLTRNIHISSNNFVYLRRGYRITATLSVRTRDRIFLF